MTDKVMSRMKAFNQHERELIVIALDIAAEQYEADAENPQSSIPDAMRESWRKTAAQMVVLRDEFDFDEDDNDR